MLKKKAVVNILIALVFAFVLTSCKEDAVEPEVYGSLTGTVVDAVQSGAIEGAAVTTAPPSSAIATDKNGKFVISNVPAGTYTITVKKPGYKTGTANVSIKEDQTTEAVIMLEKSTQNNPPNIPKNPFPESGTVSLSTSLRLAWSASDPDKGDSLRYDVYLYEANTGGSRLAASDYRDTSLLVSGLKYNTTYYWQVVAKDSSNTLVNGSVWNFKTKSFPDNPYVFITHRDGNYEIYSTDRTVENTIRLTNTPGREWWPRMSPKRDKIAFVSDEAVQPQIYTMNRDGSNLFQVTRIPVAGYHNYGMGFCWSPDGSKLLYSSYDKLYSINADGSNLTLMATAPAGRHFRECDWSLKGDKIVVLAIGMNEYDSEIYIMNSDGSDMKLLIGNLPGITQCPSFTLDGKSVIYTNDVSGFEIPTGRQLDSHIFLKGISDTTLFDLSVNKPAGTNDSYPRISPDGSKVIFTSSSNDGYGVKDIWVMDLKGSNRVKVIADAEMAEWK